MKPCTLTTIQLNHDGTEYVEITHTLTEDHFSMTGNVGKVITHKGRTIRCAPHSGGQIDELNNTKAYRWHLWSPTRGGMHYVANSLYFLGLSDYPDKENREHFESITNMGLLPGDRVIWLEINDAIHLYRGRVELFPDNEKEHRAAARDTITPLLNQRTPELLALMKADLIELFDGRHEGTTPSAFFTNKETL